MTNVNGLSTPYDYSAEIRAPYNDVIDLPQTERIYRQLVGDIRYLTESRRPELAFVNACLSMARHRPKLRY